MWRKFETHKAETKAVKDALKSAGINAEVGHGHGTAWAWLEINIGSGSQYGEHVIDEVTHSYQNCERCHKIHALADKTLKIAQEVTGRHGEYNGEIIVYTQGGWTNKKGRYEILQQA